MKKLFIVICSIACFACSTSGDDEINQSPADLEKQELLVGIWDVTEVKEKESDEWLDYTYVHKYFHIGLNFREDLTFDSWDRHIVYGGSYKVINNAIVCNIKSEGFIFYPQDPYRPVPIEPVPPQFMSDYKAGAPNYRIISISQTEAVFDSGFYMKAIKRE